MADSTDFLMWLERAEQDIKLIAVIYREGVNGYITEIKDLITPLLAR